MSPQQFEKLTEQKQRYLIEAIEIIEGKMLSNFEIRKFAKIEQREGYPCEEMVWWRLKPILHFKWSPKNGELRALKLYQRPPEEIDIMDNK